MSDYEKISGIDPANALDGTETQEMVQNGLTVRNTINQVLDFIYRLGDTIQSFNSYYKDSDKWLIYGCPKVATTGDYADLYAVVGDYFETGRVAAGWAASGAGYFYPTPPAGYIPIPAYPDYTFDYDDVNVDDTIDYIAHNMKTGTPVLYEQGTGAITGLTDDTVYYVIDHGTDEIKLASTEANAVAGTAVDITAVGTGTGHKLIFAYQLEEDAIQSHLHEIRGGGGATNENRLVNQGDCQITATGNDSSGPVSDGVYGTPRTTNKTRPAQVAVPHYIKAMV